MGWFKTKRKIRALGLRTTTGIVVDSGGLAITDGAFRLPVTSHLTTVGTMANHGISRMAMTSSGNIALAAPVSGCHKTIVLDGTTIKHTVTCAAGSYFMDATGSTSADVATFNNGAEALFLQGFSTVKWVVTNNIGSVGLA